MPSATEVILSSLAIDTAERTVSRFWREVPMRLTIPWSSFSAVKGSWLSRSIDDQPVPKSSISTLMPSETSRSRSSRTRSS